MKGHMRKLMLAVMACALAFTTATSNVQAASNYSEKAITLLTTNNLTRYYSTSSYSAATPTLTAMWDQNNLYHVGYKDGSNLVIQRYNSSMELKATVTIPLELSLYGNFTTDGTYYYVLTGQENTGTSDQVATCLAKYTLAGKKVGCCELTGYDSNPYATWGQSGSSWGTKLPFRSGSCQMAIQGNVISVIYGRQMFNGHQSNFTFFADIDTMTRVSSKAIIYCSHSFDQDVIATTDGGFLYANHGDAYSRGIEINRVSSDLNTSKEITSFHFREGAKRSYGYNETYAQLGGLAEIKDGYVLCGSSEKTLSLEEGVTGYLQHNESRDLFVQIIKKDFKSADADNYIGGETRKSVGTRPTSPSTELWLPSEGVTDYGVIWLTDYDDNYYVANPKVVTVGENTFAVLWEKNSYSAYSSSTPETYYAVLNSKGEVVVPATLVAYTSLTGNSDVSFHNGAIYWVTADGKQQKVNILSLEEKAELKITKQPGNATVTVGNTAKFSITATGTGLTYQWQKSTDGGKNWANCSSANATTASFSLTGKVSFNGMKLRCVVSDGESKLISNAVTLTVNQVLTISTQPVAASAVAGNTVKFVVKATGDELKYQWKKSTDGGNSWTNSSSTGATTNTLTMTTKISFNNYLFKCVITDKHGKKVESNAVKLTVTAAAPSITTQPASVSAATGTNAVFTVKASGDGLTYQWKLSKDGGATWANSGSSGAKTATLTMAARMAYSGYQVKCVVTDKNGKKVTSKAATLTVTSK